MPSFNIKKDLNLFDFVNNQYKIDKPVRLIELFAGIGAQAKALENIGANFEHYRICEFDDRVVKAYNLIHNTNFIASDITKLKASDLGITDIDKYTYILTYSFPCQDLSLAGKRKGMTKGSNTRSGLLWEVERLLNECQNLRQVLVMENVPMVHSGENIEDFQKWQIFLESIGYKNYWKDLNAKDYGIPQNRDRCYMISLLNSNCDYTFPQPIKLKLRLKDMLEEKVDEKYFLNGTILNVEILKNYIQYDNSNKRYCSQASRLYYLDSLCPTLPYKNHGDKSQIVFLIKKDALQYIKESKDLTKVSRRLTPKECWRLMGFSDDDFDKAKKINSNSKLYAMAGNSIVVNVLMAIFKQFF